MPYTFWQIHLTAWKMGEIWQLLFFTIVKEFDLVILLYFLIEKHQKSLYHKWESQYLVKIYLKREQFVDKLDCCVCFSRDLHLVNTLVFGLYLCLFDCFSVLVISRSFCVCIVVVFCWHTCRYYLLGWPLVLIWFALLGRPVLPVVVVVVVVDGVVGIVGLLICGIFSVSLSAHAQIGQNVAFLPPTATSNQFRAC